MGRLLRDALEWEKHLTLKRWERKSHKSSWKRRGGEEEAAPISCRWKGPEGSEIRAAYLLGLFPGDFALVRWADSSGGISLLRDGIPWEQVYPDLLRRYRRGATVPAPFRPRKRLPPEWIEKALSWTPRLQGEWFRKLRDTGLLPPMPNLDAQAVAPLRWEELRACFVDFRPPKS